MRLKKGNTIDHAEQELIQKESQRWKNVFSRLINIILYLAGNNIAFRGSSDKLYTKSNGKYLGLIQLLAKFDPVMQEHVDQIIKSPQSVHYCSKNICNELLHLLAQHVKSKILSSIQKAKYFSIIADCTPDISHLEQLIIRYVELDNEKREAKISEKFLEFISVNESTGLALSETIMQMLKDNKIELENCRGQGYDNGANMKGKKSGVQKRILDCSPLAFYMPCGCHSLNLLLCDAAKSSLKSTTLFGIIGRLYSLFAGSTQRWNILNNNLKSGLLQRPSDTRWEAKISSLKPIRFHIDEVYNALIELSEHEKQRDPQVAHEAISLSEQLEKFDFMVSLVVWYDLLFEINLVSKFMQNRTSDISQSVKMMASCKEFLEDYKENGFKKAVTDATELAKILDIEPEFREIKRVRYVKRQFD